MLLALAGLTTQLRRLSVLARRPYLTVRKITATSVTACVCYAALALSHGAWLVYKAATPGAPFQIFFEACLLAVWLVAEVNWLLAFNNAFVGWWCNHRSSAHLMLLIPLARLPWRRVGPSPSALLQILFVFTLSARQQSCREGVPAPACTASIYGVARPSYQSISILAGYVSSHAVEAKPHNGYGLLRAVALAWNP